MTVQVNRTESLSSVRQAADLVVESVKAVDATIEKSGDRATGITIPRTMSYGAAARALQRQAEAEAELIEFHHTVTNKSGFEAGLAVQQVLRQHYGVDFASPRPGFFGPTPPREFRVPTSPTTYDAVLIGDFICPEFKVSTRLTTDQNELVRLQITVQVANADKHKAELFAQRVDAVPPAWAGQIISYEANDDPYDIPKLVAPQFTLDNIALNDSETAGLQLFIDQIEHHERLAAMGIPFKRGVLLYGPYGTGKTLAGACAMSACVNAGITVLQIRSWQRVLPLVKQARDYGPVMVFVEDIDLMPSRSLTNLLDDATLKTCPISLVVTTNFPEKLDPALTRKGRLDICIGFTLPDSGTRAKILAINNVPFFDDAIDNATAGMSGADLAELSKRARITALAANRHLTASDVVGAATTMVKPPEYVQPDTLLQQLQAVMQAALGDTPHFVERTLDKVCDIKDAVC